MEITALIKELADLGGVSGNEAPAAEAVKKYLQK